jgi:PIN domain nuclease of toxin-antitoxin system
VKHKYLLDASALLALIHNEPGAEQVLAIIDDCEIHAVNLAEVMRKLVSVGKTVEEVIAYIEALNLDVIENLSVPQVRKLAELTPQAKRLGLSLGDCVCLTIAAWMGMTAVTTDRCWSEGAFNVLVLQIR